MRSLGLSAFTRRSSAALLCAGEPVAAHAEEHFSREFEDAGLPLRAARACLRQGAIEARELDHVVFFEKPLRRFERVLTCELAAFPRSLKSFPRVVGHWLGDALWLKARLVDELGVEPERVFFTSHHQAHAAAAFLTSPFESAAVLVVDGVGEWTSTSLWRGSGSALEALEELQCPHSLVDAAERIARFVGVRVDQLDSLAAHGTPRHADVFAEWLGVTPAGEVDMHANLRASGSECPDDFTALAARLGPARTAGAPLAFAAGASEHADLAAGACRALGDAYVALARRALARAESRKLCLAGDLALWPSLVERVARESGADELWVPAAPDDSGAALGAALFVQHCVHGRARSTSAIAPFLGAEPTVEAESGGVEATLDARVELLAAGHTLARVRGRMAGDGRALGPRCALIAPHAPNARRALISELRHDPEYSAPVLLLRAEDCEQALDLHPALRRSAGVGTVRAMPGAAWIARLDQARSSDGSLRAQLVERDHDPDLWALLEGLGTRCGLPALLAVELSQRGEAVVRTAQEAHELFARSTLDALDLAGRLYTR